MSGMKLESGVQAEHSMSEPLVNSPETKRLMEIAIANGVSIRTAYKAVRLRIEARRQKELDDGVEPEVVLDSFLNEVELEQRGTRSYERLCAGGLRMARRVPTAIGAILNTWCRTAAIRAILNTWRKIHVLVGLVCYRLVQ